VEEIRALGIFLERKVIHQHYGNREINNPVDKKSLKFRIAKSKTPTRGESAIEGPAVSISENRDSRNQQSRGKMHFSI
jgi:hypothetical protein